MQQNGLGTVKIGDKVKVRVRVRIKIRVRIRARVRVSYIMRIWRWEDFLGATNFPRQRYS